jgi:signal peptidase
MRKSSIKKNVGMISAFIITTILLLYIVIQIVAPDVTVRIFGVKPYVVVTESMEPEINVKDMVFVRQFSIDEAKVGDIITFKADVDYNGTKEVVTHYIYAINTSGDTTAIQTNRHWEDMNDAVADPWVVFPEDVLGTYWFQIPKIGYVTEFLKSPFGISAVLVNITVIGGIIYLVKNDNKNNKTTEKEESN